MAIFMGGPNGDHITGTNFDDSLFGKGGNDQLNGLSGNDFLDGDIGNDFMDGGPGNDTLYGWLGDDKLLGGADGDLIDGQQGADLIVGEGGDDVLIGGGDFAFDTLIGGLGRDYLEGGPAPDTFFYESASEGNDFIADFNHSQGDKILITKSFGASSPNQFSYNKDTGELFFLNTHFANLQPRTAFDPNVDIFFRPF